MNSSRRAFDAVVLAGGRARRLAGVDKPAALVGDRRLIDIALDAVAGAERIVVVGPERPLASGIVQTREDPPYSGPVAAVAAGLAALAVTDDRPVVVLAGDLPDLTAWQIDALLTELERSRVPAVFAVDAEGRKQYLLGAWRRSALEPALRGPTDTAMRALIPAETRFLPLPGVDDVDTPEDLARAVARAAGHGSVDPQSARARVRSRLTPLPVDVVPVADAAGTVLAEPLIAAAPFPPFDASAMDGYAVSGPGPWRLIDAPRAAGHTDTPALHPGQASVVATGAALPPGAERTVRHEETVLDGAVLTETSTGRDDTRRTGSAWPAGAVLAAAGTGVDAAVRSVARAAGVEHLTVRGPVRARLHTSGDEIVPDAPGGGTPTEIPWGSVRDTASEPVAGILAEAGVVAAAAGHLADRPEVFAEALADPDADLVVIIGATGRGVADHLRAALTGAGAEVILDGVNLRPGGSLLLARLPGGTPVLGLGGNPLAAVAGTVVVLPALLEALLARTPRAPETITLNDDDARLPGRWRVVPAEPDGTGRWSMPPRPVSGHLGTGHLASMLGCRGLALVPPAESTHPVERLR
ncbi:MAG: NTP transferase domain-containing protein [Gordonia sp. (in: high G+C Gram-positive bacteria)]|uniref:NTP transferase domain-containing protein n=1 Tax=Gordonia sp. (in: high G+C Gram-positive bacteria) TaxID=84139 RepID=UPI0039E5C49B